MDPILSQNLSEALAAIFGVLAAACCAVAAAWQTGYAVWDSIPVTTGARSRTLNCLMMV